MAHATEIALNRLDFYGALLREQLEAMVEDACPGALHEEWYWGITLKNAGLIEHYARKVDGYYRTMIRLTEYGHLVMHPAARKLPEFNV